tara:strand:- start:289 stop:546 length:258 start_codon:yes stop_codon:yes gene_type:complete
MDKGEIKKRIEAVAENLLNPFSQENTRLRIIRLCCNEYLKADIKLSPKEWLETFKEITDNYDEEKTKQFKKYIKKEVEKLKDSTR